MKKICKKCGVEKDLEDGYHSDKRNKDGRDAVCKECKCAVTKKWNSENKERHLASSKRDYEKNRERRIAAAVEWNRAHPKRRKELVNNWSKENPDKVRQAVQRRRARKLGCAAHFTPEDVARLEVEQEGLCVYCWNRLEGYEVDHVVPLSRGGSDGPDNICLACSSCNRSKGARLLGLEWVPPYRADAPKISLAFL